MSAFWNAIEPWVIGFLWLLSIWVAMSIVANNKRIGDWIKSANTKAREEAEKSEAVKTALAKADTAIKAVTDKSSTTASS